MLLAARRLYLPARSGGTIHDGEGRDVGTWGEDGSRRLVVTSAGEVFFEVAVLHRSKRPRHAWHVTYPDGRVVAARERSDEWHSLEGITFVRREALSRVWNFDLLGASTLDVLARSRLFVPDDQPTWGWMRPDHAEVVFNSHSQPIHRILAMATLFIRWAERNDE